MLIAMCTFSDMAQKLNRPAAYLFRLQKRFDLPTFEGVAASPAGLGHYRTPSHEQA